MDRYVINVGFAVPETPANDHHMLVTVALVVICVVFSVLFLLFLLATKAAWVVPTDGAAGKRIATERAEKTCDAVLSVCALLIPATLGLITWLEEKAGPGSYMVPLGFALFYFFALLIFTAHLRFNFLWRFDQDFRVSSRSHLRFGYWLTTATSSIVLGLVLLAIPVVELGLGILKMKEPPVKGDTVKVECNCKLPSPLPPPICVPTKPIHHHRPKTKCPCQSN
jgi:hypothetical protein